MLFAMLLENPTVMRKLINELDEALKDDELPSHIKLKSLTYLNCVINEILRLHPISHGILFYFYLSIYGYYYCLLTNFIHYYF